MTLPRGWLWLLAIALVLNSALLGGTQAGEAYACSCAGTSTVEGQFAESDAVFSGEMVRGGIEDPDPEDGAMEGGIEFRVDGSWKGFPGSSAVVYGQDTMYYGELEEGKMYTSNSCAYPFEKGERYLVYASRYEDGFRVEGCGRTASLVEAGKDLDALGPPADRLTETGGLPLPLAGALGAIAAFSASCGVLFRWARP